MFRSLRRVLQLCSVEVLSGKQHHLIKHVLRLVQIVFFISLVAEEVFWGGEFRLFQARVSSTPSDLREGGASEKKRHLAAIPQASAWLEPTAQCRSSGGPNAHLIRNPNAGASKLVKVDRGAISVPYEIDGGRGKGVPASGGEVVVMSPVGPTVLNSGVVNSVSKIPGPGPLQFLGVHGPVVLSIMISKLVVASSHLH